MDECRQNLRESVALIRIQEGIFPGIFAEKPRDNLQTLSSGALPQNTKRLQRHSAYSAGNRLWLLLACAFRTAELSDAGGPARPQWRLTEPAGMRSSDFVGRVH